MGKLVALLLSMTSLHVFAFHAQIGSYNKVPHYKVYQQTPNPHLDTLILNTVMIINESGRSPSRGTGFYIGKHNDNHIFVTNAHVMGRKDCHKSKVTFLTDSLTERRVDCEKILFSKFKNDKLDITVFTIKARNLSSMAGVGLDVNWNFKPVPAMKLAQAGFGIKRLRRGRTGKNQITEYKMNLNFDSDCVVVSEKDKLYNLSNMKTSFTFFTGCDVVGGDSGSAVIDRESGEVVGLAWGSGDTKGSLSSEALWGELIGTKDPKLLSYSSFAISMKSVKKYFKEIGVSID